MGVNVRNSFGWFSGEPRRVEVVDVGNLRVKQVKAFQNELHLPGKTNIGVHELGRRYGRRE